MLPELFLARMQRLLGTEYEAFLAAYDRPRNVGLRLNPLKTDMPPALAQFGLTPVPWAENGFYYDAQSRPGLSPYHDAGLYYLQEPSAMAPAGLLDVPRREARRPNWPLRCAARGCWSAMRSTRSGRGSSPGTWNGSELRMHWC